MVALQTLRDEEVARKNLSAGATQHLISLSEFMQGMWILGSYVFGCIVSVFDFMRGMWIGSR